MPEKERRYPEIYEWEQTTEEEGKARMKKAPIVGWLIAVLLPTCAAGAGYLTDEKSWPEFFGIGLLIGSLVGYWFYQHLYDTGLKMVLEAQRMLIIIDTEQNTREVVEILKDVNSKISSAVNTR